jgi:hypothetical protein
MDRKQSKPPLGVMPKRLWQQSVEDKRREDLRQAIARYIAAELFIPCDWLHELADLEADIQDDQERIPSEEEEE